MRIGSLFSGAGGLDMAVAQVFGGEVVWHAEIDKAASKVLAYRFPGVPNLGDISAVDWADVPAVDVLCGGFPCQDVSAAGKRAGIKAGTRSGLWSVFADAIDALRPQWVVIENVRGLLSATAQRTVDDGRDPLESEAGVVGDGAGRPVLRAAGAVLGDLADLGYDAQWATVAAADVGAPHRRERVFIVAYATEQFGSDGPRFDGSKSAVVGSRFGAGDRDSAGHTSSGIQLLGRGAGGVSHNAADSSGYGWDEGRAESARLVGGFDAAVSGDEPGVALLPTPCVVDRLATTDMTLEQWDESRRSQKERGVGSFGPRGDSLGAAVLRVEEGTVDERPDFSSSRKDDGVALLPTPTSCDYKPTDSKADHERHSPGLGAVSAHFPALLPTPNAQDGNGGGRYSSDGHQSTLPGEVRLLPTPEAKNSHAGPDYARMNREGSGGHDLVTALTLLCTPSASDGAGGKTSRSGGRIDEPLLGGQAREMTSAWGKYEPAIRRWESIVGPAPAPTEPNKNGNPRLAAAFSEWLMGWPAGWVTDPAIGISRNDQLRIVGNGVCPQQAAAALRFLLAVAA